MIDPLGLRSIGPHSGQPSPRPKGQQSHHVIQDAWAEANISNYKRDDAISILLDQKSEHKTISDRQNARRDARIANGQSKWCTTIKEEFYNAYRDLKASGVSEKDIRKALKKSYEYFNKLGAI
ncbi:TPA: hypothetical protein JGU28_004586 [Salmonella enterica]|nr:hypothetical protein [Salmonella enterica]